MRPRLLGIKTRVNGEDVILHPDDVEFVYQGEWRRVSAKPLLWIAEALDWLADRIHSIYLRVAG